jgi:hypothetical protein
MPGPLPKDPALRARTNRVPGHATLTMEPAQKRRVPALPKLTRLVNGEAQRVEWHKMTRAWWRDVWLSPMADEYLDADAHGLYRLAVLVDDFWNAPSEKLAAEIRLQQQCFGLTPIDRRRLQWEVERVEAVVKQRPPRRTEAPQEPIEDVRSVLKVLSG